MVSKRLQEVPPSGTVAISNMVAEMKASGINDIIALSLGEALKLEQISRY